MGEEEEEGDDRMSESGDGRTETMHSQAGCGADTTVPAGGEEEEEVEVEEDDQMKASGDGRTETMHSQAGCGADTTVPAGEEEEEEEEEEDSLAYMDRNSELQIQAALASLSDESRKDVFYIGSRTVCQLILVHLGRDLSRDSSVEGSQPLI